MTTDGLSLGRGALRTLRQSLLTHAPDQAITILQETGYASGEELFAAFVSWLRERHGLAGVDALDADRLSDVLSDFFVGRGWGSVGLTPLGGGALAIDSPDWVEADPGTAEAPQCFFSAGLLADFLGRLAGEPVSVLEVECRSQGDGRCRFLSATPATLDRVYDAMSTGRSYEDALSGAPR